MARGRNDGANHRGLVTRLKKLDTCSVSDALDQLGLRGAVIGLQAVSGARRIVGRAVTVRLGAANGEAQKRHLCTAAVDASGPGDVIVVANEGRVDVAGWGGILSLGASTRKIEGVIIDGACRDADQSAALSLPIYARAVVPITARGRVLEKSWNEPVEIAGVTTSPGDLVIADRSGVAFIPIAHAEAIADAAEAIAAKEQAMAVQVRAGKPLVEVMNHSYEQAANKSDVGRTR